jgi:microcystin-dependent protein
MSYDIAGTTVIGDDRRITAVSFAGHGAVPYGGIVLWYGLLTAIPTGWQLCDGTNSTPNLLDKFIVCAGDSYAVADTGGSNTVTLTTAQVPAHTHTGNSGIQSANHTHTGNSSAADSLHNHTGTTNNQNADHAHSGNTGNDAPDHGHNVGSIPNGSVEHGNRGSNSASNGRTTIGTSGATARHIHGFTTGGISANHAHAFTTSNATDNHTHTMSLSNQSANHTHTVTIDSGGGSGGSHENRPPYYALAYIMRTAV